MNIQCPNCEGILQPTDGFCTSCGRPREETAAAPDVPEVLAIFPQAQLSKGLLGFGSTMNVLVLTRDQLLIAQTSKALQEQIEDMDGELEKSFEQGEEEAHEFMKLHDFSQAPWQVYARRPLGDSQQENPHNRILELQAIQKLEVHVFDGWNDDTLKIYLAEETLKFRFMWPLGQFALETFQKVLGDKVKNLSF